MMTRTSCVDHLDATAINLQVVFFSALFQVGGAAAVRTVHVLTIVRAFVGVNLITEKAARVHVSAEVTAFR